MLDLEPVCVRNQAHRELGETAAVREETLRQLRDKLVNEQSFRPRMDEEFLLKFLRAKKFNVDKTYQTIKRYYKVRRDNPDIFVKLETNAVNFETTLHRTFVSVLPGRSVSGCTVMVVKVGAWKPSTCPLLELMRVGFLLGEYMLTDPRTQVQGVMTIADVRHLHFNHLKYYTPALAMRLAYIIQDCYPARVKAIHIVNQPYFFDFFQKLVNPLLKPKIRKRFVLHGTNWSSLHRHIDAEHLPKEYGGKLSSLNTKETEETLVAYNPFFLHDLQFGYDSTTLDNSRDSKQQANTTLDKHDYPISNYIMPPREEMANA